MSVIRPLPGLLVVASVLALSPLPARAQATLGTGNATGVPSIAISAGGAASATGNDTIAIGQNAEASSTGGIAIGSALAGSRARATASDAIAVGTNAQASGNGAAAIGPGSQVTAADAVALGSGSVAGQANTISVGSSGNERRITNIAPGTAGTDAVNVDQLNAAAAGGGGPQVDALGSRVGFLESRIDEGVRNSYRGIASVAAMSGPMQMTPGRVSVYVGGATYQGCSAVGASVAYVAPSGRYSFSGGVSQSAGKPVARVGFGFSF